MNNSINLYKKSNIHYKSKILKDSNNNIIFIEIQPKLKIINRYFKLQKLKQDEKISRFKDNYIDHTEKPKFYFMRSNLKIENKNYNYKPSTNLCKEKRSRTFSTLFKKSLNLNGFRNNNKYSGRNLETEIYPHNFDDIQSLIELREINNNNNENKYLLSDNYNNTNDNKTQKNKTLKLNENIKEKKIKNNKMSLIRNPKIEKREFTKSIILTKKKNSKYNLNLENNKKKRPITSKGNRKLSIGILKENKLDINKRKRNINSANYKLKGQKSEREYNLNLNEKNILNSFGNTSNKNISNYTTTFKSYSKSLSKKKTLTDNILFKNIEKKILDKKNNKMNTPKTTKQIINSILNDCTIIDNYIRKKEIGEDYSYSKEDKEKVLLKLADRLKNKRKLKIKIREKQPKKIPKDSIYFQEKLEKIHGVAKKFFREVYNQILFEKRVLNKVEKTNIFDAMEEKQNKKKLTEQFKKEAKDKMLITRANIITEKDDKRLLDEQKKLFDFYGNLDGLEWLITKRQILDFDRRNKRNRNRIKHEN